MRLIDKAPCINKGVKGLDKRELTFDAFLEEIIVGADVNQRRRDHIIVKPRATLQQVRDKKKKAERRKDEQATDPQNSSTQSTAMTS